MDLLNKIVLHKIFGTGKIISFDEGYMTIQFGDNMKNFVFPDAFESFLKFKNSKDIEALLPTIKEEFKIKQKKEIENQELAKKEIMFKLEAYRAEKSSKKKSKSRKSTQESSNLAFRCTYCDGGKTLDQLGFNGVCSDAMIKVNIEEEKNTWCASPRGHCFKYNNNEISRKELDNIYAEDDFICYESIMLRDWKAYAGIVVKGKNQGNPKKISRAYKNSLCVLTTCEPSMAEDTRLIFGVFLVDETFKGDDYQEGYVGNKSKYKIKLSKEEGQRLLFWNYYSNATNPHKVLWNSGLFRYFHKNQAAQILRDIVEVKKDTEDEELAKDFFNQYCKINGIDVDRLEEANGALKQVELAK